ncbi:MAG: tetratricopeptide repeat protein [Bacteroides sp.]|nr:tetratricopeptide repeat protein [Roseburia sp.]MCM1345539.1 tetratricopeptide repeat protein [Bacteroides sp.]MCM1420370.1 tetratricopeptide repeat protein [Bacteroides sp.]
MGFFKTLFTGKEDTPENERISKEKRDFDILKYDGMQALKMGKADYAIKCFEHALAIEEDADIRRAFANVLIAGDRLEDAVEQYVRLHELLPADASVAIGLSDLYFQLEDYEKTEYWCNEALNIDSALARPHYVLAKKCKVQKDCINAIVQVTQAIGAKADFFDAYLLRAQILCEMMQYVEAEKDVDYIMEHTEADEEVLFQKAIVCAALGKSEEAQRCYGNVIDMNPFIPQAYIELSRIYSEAGNNDKALSVMEEGIEQNPESPELFRTRGGLRLLNGDKEGAAADVKKSLELSPDEGKELSGKFTNMEDVMLDAYNKINPYNFSIRI